jgi:4-aminobutyrate aminotransferase-like enzyme
MGKYTYSDFEYDRFWYKDDEEKFITRSPQAKLKTRENALLASAAFKFTTNSRAYLDPRVLKAGNGPYLQDVDDNLLLDLGSGIFISNLGHSHPKIAHAISKEAHKLIASHDYMTPVKHAFNEKLIQTCDNGLSNIHIYDSGATAIDIAIKAARAITKKQEIISCFGDHHGKSLAGASLGRISHIPEFYRLPNFSLVPRPDPYNPIWINDFGEIDTDKYIDFYEMHIRESTTGKIAAFLLEPIQGWGGSIPAPLDFFKKLKKLCEKYDALLIVDEVLSGCGRTGKWLAMEHYSVNPDILILGKGIGNGFPMSVLSAKNKYAMDIASIGPSTSFGGNPMACGAGLSVLEIFNEDGILERSTNLGDFFKRQLVELKDKYEIIGNVRGLGCLLGLDFFNPKTKLPSPEIAKVFYSECLKRGLIAGIPVSNLTRLAPPLILSQPASEKAIEIMNQALAVASETCN